MWTIRFGLALLLGSAIGIGTSHAMDDSEGSPC